MKDVGAGHALNWDIFGFTKSQHQNRHVVLYFALPASENRIVSSASNLQDKDRDKKRTKCAYSILRLKFIGFHRAIT